MNQVLNELSNGGFAVVNSSNEFVVGRQIVTISPFQVAEEEVGGSRSDIRLLAYRPALLLPIVQLRLSVTIAQMSAVLGIRAVSFLPVRRSLLMAHIFMSLLALGMLMEMCYIDLQPQGRVQ